MGLLGLWGIYLLLQAVLVTDGTHAEAVKVECPTLGCRLVVQGWEKPFARVCLPGAHSAA